jgi:hypothetical protein
VSGQPPGKVVTFYSYKGGTGRSMALANIAWILASCQQRVLVVDWDLEAPGLHRYFRPFLLDRDLAASTGVIDFVIDYATEAIKPADESRPLPADWYVAHADVLRHAIPLDWEFPAGGLIDLIPAGRQDAGYAARVNSFDWQNFYDRLGGGRFLDAALGHMRAHYDYVLIDSRTGVSDTAGICTVQMPDTLAVCFTLNNQSIEGAAAVARSVYEQRRHRGDRNLRIFPLPMRVDSSEVDRRDARRRYCQWTFEPLLGHIALSSRGAYWNEVEIPYVPIFAYEEVLASFREEPSDPKSSLSAMLRATLHLTGVGAEYTFSLSPARRQEILAEFARTPGQVPAETPASGTAETAAEAQTLQAESVFNAASPEERQEIRRIFARLVRVAGSLEEATSGFGKLRVRREELGDEAVVRRLAAARLLTLEKDTATGEEMAEIADHLVGSWPRLEAWINVDMAFLAWRQRLREQLSDWAAQGEKSDYLLQGMPLRTAVNWLGTRSADLNQREIAFISASSALEGRSQVSAPGRGRAFIVRPFGLKQGIDFDRAARELIEPALAALGLGGRHTIEILRQGNIRIDMFQRLLTADLVVADLSIHNANVFYELGIRHALRGKRTFLLRAERDSYPFDLQTDRYLAYDKDQPAASLGRLTEALRLTLASEDQDSPVFRSLPDLEEQERSRFLPVPRGFREEVELAKAAKRAGDLGLLAVEAEGFEWENEGLRLVGRAQLALRDYSGTRATWEMVRRTDPDDLEASTWLGTIYQRLASQGPGDQRLGYLTRSDQAMQRVLARKRLAPKDRAEANALIGRNAKTRWKDDWLGSPGDPAQARREKALRSPFLEQSIDAYARGFDADLNHFYSGLNAHAMLTVQVELARALPEIWSERFESESEAARDLEEKQSWRDKLATAVELSLAARQKRLAQESTTDPWVEISVADLRFLTSKRPPRVTDAYRKALAGVSDFEQGAVRDQLCLYQLLEILPANVEAALSACAPGPPCDQQPAPPPLPPRFLLFTGHTIDAPRRAKPRFPPAMEDAARAAIRQAIERELARPGGVAGGLAGGASGGDILFHELCAQLGIRTQLFLALPKSQFSATSVAPAGGSWCERFDRLASRLPTRVLAESPELPAWLAEKRDYSIWQRNNLWMLHNALALGNDHVTLIALWNGERGDGPGGTGDLVERARERQANTVILDTRKLFGLETMGPPA